MTRRAFGFRMAAAANLLWAARRKPAGPATSSACSKHTVNCVPHLAAFNDDLEVQDNATRVGMNFATRGKIKMFAGTEWGVNIVQSETQFNLSAGGPGEFGTVASTTNPVFLARLGFIGVDFGPLGKVAIGKQYAVHYDIASYTTDRFNVFGGQGTHAYVAGTDGGETGTAAQTGS